LPCFRVKGTQARKSADQVVSSASKLKGLYSEDEPVHLETASLAIWDSLVKHGIIHDELSPSRVEERLSTFESRSHLSKELVYNFFKALDSHFNGLTDTLPYDKLRPKIAKAFYEFADLVEGYEESTKLVRDEASRSLCNLVARM
jgi:hypothetical protein